ncbi:hypothetical protein ACHQM5_002806 [Ranunculus cassubicifolius]
MSQIFLLCFEVFHFSAIVAVIYGNGYKTRGKVVWEPVKVLAIELKLLHWDEEILKDYNKCLVEFLV